jgi:AcrR family transcriptional regulator
MRSSRELSETTPLGRPREFDLDRALERAMLVFWRKGYEGASMSDLTASLGVTKPSLYAAFGAKEQLFRAVLDRYDKRTAHFLSGSMRAVTAREVAIGLLRGSAPTAPVRRGGRLAIVATVCARRSRSGWSARFARMICPKALTPLLWRATWSSSCAAWRSKRPAAPTRLS